VEKELGGVEEYIYFPKTRGHPDRAIHGLGEKVLCGEKDEFEQRKKGSYQPEKKTAVIFLETYRLSG